MTEIEALRAELASLRLQVEVAIAVGGLLFVAFAVALTVLWQRVAARGEKVREIVAARVRRVPRGR